MKVQIYLRTPEDAAMSAAAGADFIGVVADEGNLAPASLGYEKVREVFAATPGGAMKVALSLIADRAKIIEMIRATNPDVVHLAGDALVPPEGIAELRATAPTVKIMQAISMNGPDPIETALRFAPVADYFLLDTDAADLPGIGATGRTHDWAISAELVRRVHVPVLLAGGLSPENVAGAIRAVRPWGVDSFSLTNLPGSPVRKDPEKVRSFIANAKSA